TECRTRSLAMGLGGPLARGSLCLTEAAGIAKRRSAFTLERDCIPMNSKERLTNRLGSVWFLALTAIRR
ncbi:hypothetical protein KAX17_06965, partial [Candidatus Bipolaricaulota bacterium]|nr:hypothetical protein [Candidatus Bipolaricaulota bacterium]